jgi:hypothetical protein
MGTASDKQPYLVGYDYGTGGLWGVMLARSENEIVHLYPELAVVHDRPGWMSDEDHTRMCKHAYDIDGAPGGMLNVVLSDRHRD